MTIIWPWWILLLPVIRPLIMVGFVLVAGLVQGRTTGIWPTLSEWTSAVSTVRPFARRMRTIPTKQIGSPPCEGDEPTFPT
jgi:hypothetical protein